MNSVNDIPNGWMETTLGEVSSKMYSGGTPSTKKPEFYGGNIPWIRTQEVTFNFITETEIKITEEGLNKSSAKWIPEDTVIVAMYGNSAGRVALSKIKATTNQACCNFIANPNVSDSYFIFYNLLSRYKEIEGKANGAAQQNLSVGVLKELIINLPPLQEQKAIANILTAFDNKIENLQAQNKTLEKTAQTIFKEWFGKYQVGDLSADKAGELPVKWSFEKLETIADHIKDNIKPFDQPEKDYLHYSLPAYDNGLVPEIEKGSTIKSNKYKVVDNSFLVSKLNPFTPRIWTIFNSGDNHICSTEFQVVKPKSDEVFALVHCFLNSKKFTAELSQNIKGTSSSHQRVNPQDIFNIKLVLPNKNDLNRFNSLIYPMVAKNNINRNQIRSLKKTRDTLLPKLMSGKIRVNEFKESRMECI